MATRGRYNPINYTNLAGKLDHGLLLGLGGVADHTGYLLVNGGRALGGHWDLGGYNLTNGAAITISGPLTAGAGSAAAPSIACSTYGGMYGFSDSGNNALGFSTAGGQRLRYTQYNDKWAFSAADIDFASGNLITTGTLSAGAITGTSLALGGGNLTMSGSIASVGTPVLKGWFTDLDVADDLVVDSDLTVGGLINDMTIQGIADGNIRIGDPTTLSNITSGEGLNNIAIGKGAGAAITTGDANICIGNDAGAGYTNRNSLLFIGDSAGKFTTGYGNSCVGPFTMASNKYGNNNTAIGTSALRGIGVSSQNYTGNTAIGLNAGYLIRSSGNYNTFIGAFSGDSVTSGANNLFLGYESGGIVSTGSGNTMIGYNVGKAALGKVTATGSNILVIDNMDTATPLISGYFATHASGPHLDIYGSMDIGDGTNETQISATGVLTMAGNAAINGLKLNIVAKTAAYTATATDDVITCGAGNETFTIDLPAALDGKVYYIKNVGTGVITVDADTTGSTTIDGDTTQTVNQYECLQVISDASVYWIL